MSPEIETCTTCGRRLLLTEQAYVLHGEIVCEECDRKLRAADPGRCRTDSKSVCPQRDTRFQRLLREPPLEPLDIRSEDSEAPHRGHRTHSRLAATIRIVGVLCLVLAFLYSVLWRETKEGKVVVFVIDSAAGSIPPAGWGRAGFKEHQHREIVSGIISRYAKPLELVARNVDTYDSQGGHMDHTKYEAALLETLQFAQTHKDCRIVVNMSFGATVPGLVEGLLIKQMGENGIVMVAAAGNDGISRVDFPAAFDEVLAVGACRGRKVAAYSNHGEDIDIFATGDYATYEVQSDSTEGATYTRYAQVRGTSFAAPRVTGVIVQLLQYRPDLSAKEVREILRRNSHRIEGHKSGALDGLKALSIVSKQYKFRYYAWMLTKGVGLVLGLGIALLFVLAVLARR